MRKAKPYAAYSDFEFDIPIGEIGDTYDRYMVRMEEMRQSARIVAQAVEKIPDGPIMAKLSKIIKPPVGDIYHSIESPKGELGYYIVSDGSTHGVPGARAAAVVREFAGVAADGGRAHGRRRRRGDRNAGHRVG